MTELSDKELLDALGVEVKTEKKKKLSAREERIIAGFEEIQNFVEEHERMPEHGEGNDIFERLYASRLDQIKKLPERHELLDDIDHQDLLKTGPSEPELAVDDLSDDELLSQLGIEHEPKSDLSNLVHVKSRADVRKTGEIGSRKKCEDFDKFKPMFEKIQKELDRGLVEAKLIEDSKGFSIMAQINKGDWFIVNGQKAYVAELSDKKNHGFDNNDYRLRVIYDNGTESDLLLRSLQKALYEDSAGRRIVSLSAGPLFSNLADEDDISSGIIYVLRSKSNHPDITNNRDVIHKIGVTSGCVEKRIANAKLDPTFLMDDVEIVSTYQLFNISRTKLENILHRFFGSARLDIEIKDRFGNPVTPREWFLVPLFVIDEVVEKIKDGSIDRFYFDKNSASLKEY